MKSAVAAQVAIVLLLVASAASCEVAKEYSTRVFKPTVPQKIPDSTVTGLKFMEFNSGNEADSVDIKELFAKESKAENVKDSVSKVDPVVVENRISRGQPIDATKRNAARSKKVRQ